MTTIKNLIAAASIALMLTLSTNAFALWACSAESSTHSSLGFAVTQQEALDAAVDECSMLTKSDACSFTYCWIE